MKLKTAWEWLGGRPPTDQATDKPSTLGVATMAEAIGIEPDLWGLASCRVCRKLILATDGTFDATVWLRQWDATPSERRILQPILGRVALAEIAANPHDPDAGHWPYDFATGQGGEHVCETIEERNRKIVKRALAKWLTARAAMLQWYGYELAVGFSAHDVSVVIVRPGHNAASSRARGFSLCLSRFSDGLDLDVRLALEGLFQDMREQRR